MTPVVRRPNPYALRDQSVDDVAVAAAVLAETVDNQQRGARIFRHPGLPKQFQSRPVRRNLPCLFCMVLTLLAHTLVFSGTGTDVWTIFRRPAVYFPVGRACPAKEPAFR